MDLLSRLFYIAGFITGFVSASLLTYSVYLLLRKPILMTTGVDPDQFLLEIIAVTEPRIKGLLSPPPDELSIMLTDAPPPMSLHEAAFTARRGDAKETVTIDLNKHKELEPLVDVLLGWSDSQSERA